MFERFTDQARRVVVLAQEEARMLGHNYIGTEHLLLGLLAEGEGTAARALRSMEISLEVARVQVAEIIGEGTGQPTGHIPFTPRTKKVLELSLREAQRLGDSYIGTEHLLLGLAREGEGVGAQILERLGASMDRVQAQVLATIRTTPQEELRRISVGPRGARATALEHPGGVREVLSRLDEIAERLTAIEAQLAGLVNPPSRAARKPPAAGQGKPAAGQDKPATGQGKPATGQDKPATGQDKPAAGGQRKPRSGGRPSPGQQEPPAAEA
jgi:ATP-dependent Clp protease ATP-binding subunit ClpC